MSIHLHHVHMNVANRERSESFYEKFLAAKRVTLNGATEALHTAPVLLLLDEVAQPPKSDLPTALQHVGFGSSDVPAWYASAHQQGVAPDTRGFTLFNTGETPSTDTSGLFGLLTGGQPSSMCTKPADKFEYMYVLGPDKERIEVWTGADLRVNHVHFTTPDVASTASWYQRFLGITNAPNLTFYLFNVDDIVFFFEAIGERGDYKPTDDYVLGHVAFSVTDLDAWLKRAQDQSIEIVAQPALVNGFKSFFVRGPDGVLIELVQAAPQKELCLEPASRQGPSAGAAGGR